MNLIKKFLTQELRKKVSPNQLKRAIGKKAPSDRTVILRYNSQLQGAQKKINAELRKAIQPLIAETLRSDALDPLGDFFNGLEQSISELLKITGIENIIKINADSIVNLNFRKYDTELYKAVGINALPKDMEQSLVNNWIRQNTDLITKVNKTQLNNLKRLFRDSAFTGQRAKSLHADINKIFGGSRNNVSVIARDQVSKLGGQLDQLKQQEAGVDGYYWRTSRDERVRSSHVHLEGKFFRWDRPPEIGHPGQPIQCRCDAEPALDRMLLEGKELKKALTLREEEDKIRRQEARERTAKK